MPRAPLEREGSGEALDDAVASEVTVGEGALGDEEALALGVALLAMEPVLDFDARGLPEDEAVPAPLTVAECDTLLSWETDCVELAVAGAGVDESVAREGVGHSERVAMPLAVEVVELVAFAGVGVIAAEAVAVAVMVKEGEGEGEREASEDGEALDEELVEAEPVFDNVARALSD